MMKGMVLKPPFLGLDDEEEMPFSINFTSAVECSITFSPYSFGVWWMSVAVSKNRNNARECRVGRLFEKLRILNVENKNIWHVQTLHAACQLGDKAWVLPRCKRPLLLHIFNI